MSSCLNIPVRSSEDISVAQEKPQCRAGFCTKANNSNGELICSGHAGSCKLAGATTKAQQAPREADLVE